MHNTTRDTHACVHYLLHNNALRCMREHNFCKIIQIECAIERDLWELESPQPIILKAITGLYLPLINMKQVAEEFADLDL
mmetsp:Transcript_37398/g.68941  ORF Transcript_37398/g.68941 Transcript_37398/m.68941 type:complete len:80 (+) Transcript_37398:143-382(+)